MSPAELLNLAKGWEAVIGGAFGVLAGWFGRIAKNRLQHERNTIDAEKLENEQLKLALERERFLTDRVSALLTANDRLWGRLYAREAVIKDYHTAALAAQREVNELEDRLHLPVSQFPELPEFPPVDEEKISK